jgi:hypothetical protein
MAICRSKQYTEVQITILLVSTAVSGPYSVLFCLTKYQSNGVNLLSAVFCPVLYLG